MMKKLFLALLLTSLVKSTFAQSSEATNTQTQVIAQQILKMLKDAESSGIILGSTSNVQDSVNIEAVMLPAKIVKHVFGTEVANNYAVIEVNVSNRNPDAAFILGSLYIDYSQWGLAAMTRGFNPKKNPVPYASSSSSNFVSSVEYRVVRGEVLDKQPYTTRNLAIRSIKVLGQMGTAFAFPFSPDVVKGINAWNGGVVPGFDELFPDGTTAQMNRISDYGFRNNKVIPQQSADIVIAFFPIGRFLSPTLEKTFKKSPALFFNPLLLALDPATRKGLDPLLDKALGEGNVDSALQGLLDVLATTDPDQLDELSNQEQSAQASIASDKRKIDTAQATLDRTQDVSLRTPLQLSVGTLKNKLHDDQKALADAQKALNDALKLDTRNTKTVALYRFLNSISLGRVSVVVGGTMNVDEQTIPASISSTCFDAPAPDLWGSTGIKTCTVHGRFLLHGVPKFQTVDGSDLHISDIAIQENSSSSDIIAFTYKLAAVREPPKFTLIITKEGKNKTSVDSTPYAVDAKTLTYDAPTITSVKSEDDGSLTITGKNFYSIPTVHPLTVNLTTKGTPTKIDTFTIQSDTQITLPKDSTKSIATGCYQVVIDNLTSSPGKSDKANSVNQVKDGKATAPDPCLPG